MPTWPATSGRIRARAPTRRNRGGPAPGLYSAAFRGDRPPLHAALEAEIASADEAVRRECMPALPLWERL
eukprot:5629139-Pyramimonas_sp.AAC.1